MDSLESLNDGNDAPASEPHIHLTVVPADSKPCQDGTPKESDLRWLNGFREDTLHSVWSDDALILLSQRGQENLILQEAEDSGHDVSCPYEEPSFYPPVNGGISEQRTPSTNEADEMKAKIQKTKKPKSQKAAVKKATVKKAAVKKVDKQPVKKTAKGSPPSIPPAKAGGKAKRKPNAAFMAPVQPDAALAAIVGEKPLPRTEITKKLWEYIKSHGLQDQANKRMIHCDDLLIALFGKDSIGMFEMQRALIGHFAKP